MIKKSIGIVMFALFLATIYSGAAFAKITADEAAKLGTTLTYFGAEMAGNKAGTIPAYTGGLTTPPAGFDPKTGRRPDPFANDKPLFTIDVNNMAQYMDKLTPGTVAMMKKYPGYKIVVYPTRRSAAAPDWVYKGTVANAQRSYLTDGGCNLRSSWGGVPFPIPKTGHEIVWNAITRWRGLSFETKTVTDLMDANGKMYSTAAPMRQWDEQPFYVPDKDRVGRMDCNNGIHWKLMWTFDGPPRKAGEGGMSLDVLTPEVAGDMCYLYLPGQRRVKVAPEVSYDTPHTDGAGTIGYDETWLYNGDPNRYDFKIVGKKEMYVPYNAYKAYYFKGTQAEEYGPKFVNPDIIRYELHRVWVVEGTLRKGFRHVLPRRVLYADEDSWAWVAAESYDARGGMAHVGFAWLTMNYDIPAINSGPFIIYNLNAGTYCNFYSLPERAKTYLKVVPMKPERFWTPDNLAATSAH